MSGLTPEPPVEPVLVTAPMTRREAEQRALEIQRLASVYGVEIATIRIERVEESG